MGGNGLVPAKTCGASDAVASGTASGTECVLYLTVGAGVDVAIYAVGMPQTFRMALDIVRPCGRVANVGVHGKPVDLHLEDLWIRNINISMGLVNANSTPMLLKLVAQKKIPAGKFATHHFPLGKIMDAYDTFSRAAETKALKVVLSR